MKNIVKNKKQNMTIDKLARMTANGFSQMDEKFNELKGEFSGLKGEFNELRIEFNDLKSEVNQKIEHGIDRMLVIANDMAGQFAHWKQENAVGAIVEARQDEQLKDHEVRIKKLETV